MGVAAWAMVASWLTAGVAAVAATVGLLQVREVRRTRTEEAQPYVVAFMQSTQASPQLVDLVIENFGRTAAYEVQMTVAPALRRTAPGGVEDVWVFDELPVLAPTQQWRTLWDFAPKRLEAELPGRHEGTIRYLDARGEEHESPFVLDWAAFAGRRYVEQYGLHHAAKALREVRDELRRWGEGPGGGLAVVVRDGDARDRARDAQLDEFRAGGFRDPLGLGEVESEGEVADGEGPGSAPGSGG